MRPRPRTLLCGLFVAALLAAAGQAAAQDKVTGDEPPPDKAAYNRVFLDTLARRCVPGAHSGDYDTDGMARLPAQLAAPWLNGAKGTVWSPTVELHVLLVVREAGGCIVVAAFGDAAAMETAVADRFGATGSAFERTGFERTADGGFEARYEDGDCAPGQRCKILVSARAAPEAGQIAMMGAAARVDR